MINTCQIEFHCTYSGTFLDGKLEGICTKQNMNGELVGEYRRGTQTGKLTQYLHAYAPKTQIFNQTYKIDKIETYIHYSSQVPIMTYKLDTSEYPQNAYYKDGKALKALQICDF